MIDARIEPIPEYVTETAETLKFALSGYTWHIVYYGGVTMEICAHIGGCWRYVCLFAGVYDLQAVVVDVCKALIDEYGEKQLTLW